MSVPTYAYAANNPVLNFDPDGRSPWRVAVRVVGAGIRKGKRISASIARALVRNGDDVVTNSEASARQLGNKLSNQAGGGGACTAVERHGLGARHIHPLGAGGERLENVGHIFIDESMTIVPLDIDQAESQTPLENAFDMTNVLPGSMRFWMDAWFPPTAVDI